VAPTQCSSNQSGLVMPGSCDSLSAQGEDFGGFDQQGVETGTSSRKRAGVRG